MKVFSLNRAMPSLEAIEIEVAMALKIPNFHIIGLPTREVVEAQNRIQSAFLGSGLKFPRKKVTVNLTPVEVPKVGVGLDLPMALAILSQQIESDQKRTLMVPSVFAWGELSLDGTIKSPGHELRALSLAEKLGAPLIFFPLASKNRIEGWILELLPNPEHFLKQSRIVFVENLSNCQKILKKPLNLPLLHLPLNHKNKNFHKAPEPEGLHSLPKYLERILGVAMSGRHHLLLWGCAGVGKSHLFEWAKYLFPTPPLSVWRERLILQDFEAGISSSPSTGTKILWHRRVSAHIHPVHLLGTLKSGCFVPGEFAYAHQGLLFGDELAEWPRDSLEALREPLETNFYSLVRQGQKYFMPACFQFLATSNLCPCGKRSTFEGGCGCTGKKALSYQQKISYAVRDRIDVNYLVVPRSPHLRQEGTPAQELREKVDNIYNKSLKIFGIPTGLLTVDKLKDIFHTQGTMEAFFAKTQKEVGEFSLRAFHKVLRLAVTLSFWDGFESPKPHHLQEAFFLNQGLK